MNCNSQGFSSLTKPSQGYSRLKIRIIFSFAFFFVFFAFSAVNAGNAASVLIPLQTCGIAPAADRNLVLTPLQALGANEIPVMDRIQTNTDQNGNAWLSLLPGVYQCQVRPAWGQVGVTDFYFYVDPSNAVQDAFTNLLTATNNTYPPNQYAWSAQASDARYAPIAVAPGAANAVTNTQYGVTLGFPFLWGPGLVWFWTTNSNGSLELQDEGQGGTPQWLFWGNGNFAVLGNNGGSGGYGNVTGAVITAQSAMTIQGNPVETNGTPVPFATNAMTATNALSSLALANIPESSLVSGYLSIFLTNQFLDWWSADLIPVTNNWSVITNWTGRNGNALVGTATYSAFGMYGYPAVFFNNQLLTNLTILGSNLTNAGTLFVVYRQPRSVTPAGNLMLCAGVDKVGTDFSSLYLSPNQSSGSCPFGFFSIQMTNGVWQQYPDNHFNDDLHVFSMTWNPNGYQDYTDGKMANNSAIALGNGAYSPMYMVGTLCVGSDFSKFASWGGYISELFIATNSFSAQAMDAGNNYFLNKLNRLRTTIVISGDSVPVGGVANYGGDLVDYLAANFPNVTIDNIAYPGGSSTQMNSLETNWDISSTDGGLKIGIWYFSLNNDGIGIGNLNTTTNNMFAWAQNAQTNGIITIVVNPQSNKAVDTNGQRFVFQSIVTNVWTNYFNAIVDLSRDPNFGQTNQWTNTAYFSGDGIHPTNAFYQEAVQCFFAPVIGSILYGNYSCSTTTAPPPTITQPWTCIYQNHYYWNSNGQWALIH